MINNQTNRVILSNVFHPLSNKEQDPATSAATAPAATATSAATSTSTATATAIAKAAATATATATVTATAAPKEPVEEPAPILNPRKEVLKYSMTALSEAVLTSMFFYYILIGRVFPSIGRVFQRNNTSTATSTIKKQLQSLLMEVVNCSAVAVVLVLVMMASFLFTSVLIYYMQPNSTTQRCVTALLLAAVGMAVLTIIFFNFLLIGQVFRRNNTSTTASLIKKEVQSLHMEVVKCGAVAVQAAMAMTAFYFITFVFIYYMQSSNPLIVIDTGASFSIVPLDFRLTNERPTPNGQRGRSASNHIMVAQATGELPLNLPTEALTAHKMETNTALLSLGETVKHGCIVVLGYGENNDAIIYDKNNIEIIVTGPPRVTGKLGRDGRWYVSDYAKPASSS